ncbi:unnamed protein product [Linum trigynum]|uniref:Uncharacterized protein n=1 Tax=Linum trigynum TaxID=586398 RepID=A0AAV2GQ42_9ROSI
MATATDNEEAGDGDGDGRSIFTRASQQRPSSPSRPLFAESRLSPLSYRRRRTKSPLCDLGSGGYRERKKGGEVESG